MGFRKPEVITEADSLEDVIPYCILRFLTLGICGKGEACTSPQDYNAVSMMTSITMGMKKTRAVIPMIAGIFR